MHSFFGKSRAQLRGQRGFILIEKNHSLQPPARARVVPSSGTWIAAGTPA